MIVRVGELRKVLRFRGAGQIAQDALIRISMHLEDLAETFAGECVRALEERNVSRDVQRIPLLRRLTIRDVETAIGRLHGKE